MFHIEMFTYPSKWKRNIHIDKEKWNLLKESNNNKVDSGLGDIRLLYNKYKFNG